MKKGNNLIIFCLVVFFLGSIGFMYSQATGTGDVDSDGEVTIIDALLIAQYYVGLNPENFDEGNAYVNCDDAIDIIDALMVAQLYVDLIPEFPKCPHTVRTLIVETEGQDTTLPNCDGIPYISPPDMVITGATRLTYEHGTIVDAYILGSTPPPPGTPWQSAVLEYEGELTYSISIEMDADKTIKVIFTTYLNPAPTPVP